MAGRVKYNPKTGMFEAEQPGSAALKQQADEQIQEIINDPKNVIPDENKVVPDSVTEVKTDSPAGSEGNSSENYDNVQKEAQETEQVSTVPQMDTQAVYDARQQQIQADEAAAKAEQEARQSGIDQYNEMVRGWMKESEDLKQQQAEAEKRARVSSLVAGIADGVAALTNLYFTTKGAPNIQQHSGLEKYQDIYDKAKRDRQALRQQLNLRLQQGQLNLSQLRQQQAIASAKANADISKKKADAEVEKAKGDIANQQAVQEQRRYEEKTAEEVRRYEQNREDRKAEKAEDLAYRREKDAEDRQVRMQQMGLQYAARQDALDQRKSEARVKAFNNRYGEDVSLDIDGKTYNFGYKPLTKQLVRVSESVYREAKQTLEDKISEIDAQIGSRSAIKESGLTEEQVNQKKAERKMLGDTLVQMNEDWDNAQTSNSTEVFASKYLDYSKSGKASLINMSKDYEKERNAAYGIEDTVKDDEEEVNFDDPKFDSPTGETQQEDEKKNRWAGNKRQK